MIITLTGIGLIVVGACLVCYYIALPEHYSGEHEIFCILGSVAIIVGLIWMLICVVVLIDGHSFVDEKIYTKELERESIIKQIEYLDSEYADASGVEVIGKTYEWNEFVHNIKYHSESPWTSWFYSKKYVDSLDIIDVNLIEDMRKSR